MPTTVRSLRNELVSEIPLRLLIAIWRGTAHSFLIVTIQHTLV